MQQIDRAHFHRIAKALADPRRFEILELIATRGEICCGTIVDSVNLSQPTVSHHLKVLGDSGLVLSRREGQHAFFRIAPEALRGYLDEVERRTRLASPAGVRTA